VLCRKALAKKSQIDQRRQEAVERVKERKLTLPQFLNQRAGLTKVLETHQELIERIAELLDDIINGRDTNSDVDTFNARVEEMVKQDGEVDARDLYVSLQFLHDNVHSTINIFNLIASGHQQSGAGEPTFWLYRAKKLERVLRVLEREQISLLPAVKLELRVDCQ